MASRHAAVVVYCVFSAGRKGGARRGDARLITLPLDMSHEIVRFVGFNVENCDRSSPLNKLLVKPVWFVRTEQMKRRCHAPYFTLRSSEAKGSKFLDSNGLIQTGAWFTSAYLTLHPQRPATLQARGRS